MGIFTQRKQGESKSSPASKRTTRSNAKDTAAPSSPLQCSPPVRVRRRRTLSTDNNDDNNNDLNKGKGKGKQTSKAPNADKYERMAESIENNIVAPSSDNVPNASRKKQKLSPGSLAFKEARVEWNEIRAPKTPTPPLSKHADPVESTDGSETASEEGSVSTHHSELSVLQSAFETELGRPVSNADKLMFFGLITNDIIRMLGYDAPDEA